ncbi:hypothetical protein QM201_09045 [Enterobacter asburiae]|nr:hypothetical protein [Enterobacter asburiae]
MDSFLKTIHITLITIVAFAIAHSLIRGVFERFTKKKILSNPCYIDATILQVKSKLSPNSEYAYIHVDYSFIAENGKEYKKKGAQINIKASELQNYLQGAPIPVVYLKSNPDKNMLYIRDAAPGYKKR